MRAGVLTPTMTAVAFATLTLCMTGAGAQAADQASNARDQEFIAIQGLIDHDQRAPAQHLKDDFAGANYPADQWCRDALDWMYADRFRSSETDPATQKKLDDLYATIGPKLQAAVDANAADVPDVVKTMWKAKGSPLLRLVNDLGRVINPNLPPPLIGKANISAADKATRNHQVADLCAEAAKEFKKGEDAVTAFDAGPGAHLFDISEDKPEYKKLAEQATTVRFEAIRPLYLAHIILREVLTRGDDFGIDPAPVKAFYKDLFTKDNVDTIGKYDYDWGDNNPWLKAYANVILCEAVRQGVKDVTADDIESEIQKVIADNPNTMNGPMRVQFVALQLNMFQHLIRWQLELNTPKSLKHGAELTAQLQDQVKNDSTLRVKGDDEKAIALAECYVVAARLAHEAKNNNGVSTWLGPVMAARENPMSTNAKMWSVYFTGSSPGGSGNDWGEEPSPEEPGAALATAQAYIQQANATPDAKQARGFYLKAAVSLRDAVLALTTPAYEDQFNDVGPQIYSEFASACYHLDMRYHAALVAEEGLRAVSLKVTDKSNPWKGNEAVKRLEGNGIAYAQGLQARATGPAVAHIWDDTIGLIKKISPEDGNKSLDRMQIQLDITTGQWDDAIRNLDAYAKTYPDADDQFWAFNNRINAMQGHFNALAAQLATNPGVKDDMDKVGAATSKIANDMLAKLADTEKTRALTDPELKARASAQTVELYQDFAAGRFKDVIDKLGPDFWKHPPGDEALAVSMLKMMSNATFKFHEQTFSSDAAKKDPGTALQANWPVYQGVYAIFKSHATNYKSPESVKPLRDSSRLLAAVFNRVSNLGEPLAGTSTAIAAMLDEARKATADLVAPTLSANSKASQLVAIGDLLFNMDDHVGAGRLYAYYLANLDNDADLQAFVQAPKSRLDEVENIIGSRPELKTEWAKLRDRLEDQDHPGIPRDQWGELPINYGIAAKLMKDFIAHVDQLKTVLGNDLAKQADDELQALQKIVISLAQRIRVKSRLAQIDRETGKSDESRKLYDELISYDPDDPDFKVAYVENVIADVKNPPPTGVPPKDQLEKARSTAVDLRDNAGSDLVTYWTASIQVMELSFALDDLTPINNTLHHITASKSDLSQDLIQPQVRADKRITGDDKRVRRAKNALAGNLAQRFLDLYGKPGVTEKPLFRVATVNVDGKDWILFIDAGAPDMVGTTTTNDEGTDVVVFRPAGDAVEQPESATGAAPAGSATPAAAAPPADNAATPAAPSPSATGAAP